MGGETANSKRFQSTSPVRGTTAADMADIPDVTISIHVPREGDDIGWYQAYVQLANISIHVPREGDDAFAVRSSAPFESFQSTSPVRGTTAKVHKNGAALAKGRGRLQAG